MFVVGYCSTGRSGNLVLTSFLSSACCALQLFLNLFSVGCAGFNTVLGPLRPVLLSGAVLGQCYMWSQIQLSIQYPAAIRATAVTVVVSFMPEYLYLYNRYLRSPPTASAADPTAATTTPLHTIEIHLENMGCVACVNTITNTMLACKGVGSVHVRLEDDAADVGITKDCNVEDMCLQVTDIGFPARQVLPLDGKEQKQNQPTSVAPETSAVVEMVWAVGAGLVSSSCCALQLGLNVLSAFNVIHIGCAGFNTYLGPLRGATRTIALGWLTFLWSKHWWFGVGESKEPKEQKKNGGRKQQQRQQLRLMWSSIVTLLLMFLPELLRLTGGPSIAPPTNDQMVLQYNVPNMGCEACETNVRRIISRQDGVVNSEVDFDVGTARIVVAKNWNFDVNRLEKELVDAGYGLLKFGAGGGGVKKEDEREECGEECEAEELDW